MAEKDNRVKQLPAPKKDAIQPASQPPGIVEKVEKELQTITDANFYMVPGRDGNDRKEPDSRALQYYANKSGGISTKILDSGMDETHAWAHVQAWKKDDPALVMEDKVTIVFQLEFEGYVWDNARKGCKRHRGGCPIVKENGKARLEHGVPVLEDVSDIMDLRMLMNRKQRFAERECITKAKSRLYKQLLSMDWRDPEEVESEDRDVASITDNAPARTASSAASNTQSSPATPSAATAAATAPKPVEKPKEAPKAPSKEPEPKAKPEAPATSAQAPAAAATAPAPAKNGGVPQAVIPPSPFTGVSTDKLNSEWMALLVASMQTTAKVIVVYSAARLGYKESDFAVKGSPAQQDLKTLLFAIWKCTEKYPSTTVATFIKGEAMSDEFKKKIGDDLLLFFATEKNRLAEVK